MEPRFGVLLARIRQRRGLSQNQLATSSGYDHSHISRLESGARLPTRVCAMRLADALAVIDEEREALLSATDITDRAYASDPDLRPLAKLLCASTTLPEHKAWIRSALRQIVDAYGKQAA